MSSGLEIERKFLVKKGGNYRDTAFNCTHIKQGYIPAEGATVRIRLRDDRAFLTIKGRSTNHGLSRYEFEKEITPDEAEHLMALCKGGVIDKHRYLVKSGSHTFEVDEFHGDNDGLVMAEVELQNDAHSHCHFTPKLPRICLPKPRFPSAYMANGSCSSGSKRTSRT